MESWPVLLPFGGGERSGIDGDGGEAHCEVKRFRRTRPRSDGKEGFKKGLLVGMIE